MATSPSEAPSEAKTERPFPSIFTETACSGNSMFLDIFPSASAECSCGKKTRKFTVNTSASNLDFLITLTPHFSLATFSFAWLFVIFSSLERLKYTFYLDLLFESPESFF